MFKQMINLIQKRFLSIWFLIIIIMIILPNSFLRETPLQFSVTSILFFFLLSLFWVPSRWLTPFRTELVTFLLGSVSILKSLIIGGDGYGLMLPLAVFMAARMEEKRSLIYASIFGVITTIFIFFDKNVPPPGPVSFPLTYIGCFIGARGYRVQNEANKSNLLHLKELQKAHIELQHAHDEIQEAAIHTMQVAVLEERTRIAREMHDALGHSLTSLIVQLHALQYMLHGGPVHAQDAVKNMLGVAKQSLEDIRNSVHTLAIDKSSLGLTPLRAFLAQTEKNTCLSIEFHAEEEVSLSQEITIVFYRVLQEAVTNTLRHSQATRMYITIDQNEDTCNLSIWDNGKISSSESITQGFGLAGMQERIRNLNGSITYYVREPQGFQIDLKVPYVETATKGMTKK